MGDVARSGITTRESDMTENAYAALCALTAAPSQHSDGFRAIFRREREQRRLYREVAAQFGTLNGWKLAKKQAHRPEDIGRRSAINRSWRLLDWMDHPISYRADGRYVALVGQPYGDSNGGIAHFAEDIDRCTAKLNLRWHIPPDPLASIWYPGSTLFIVITTPDIQPVWLPEQIALGRWPAGEQRAGVQCADAPEPLSA
jgi:hypothetical protein